jgi:hypothetical protein
MLFHHLGFYDLAESEPFVANFAICSMSALTSLEACGKKQLDMTGSRINDMKILTNFVFV